MTKNRLVDAVKEESMEQASSSQIAEIEKLIQLLKSEFNFEITLLSGSLKRTVKLNGKSFDGETAILLLQNLLGDYRVMQRQLARINYQRHKLGVDSLKTPTSNL